MKRPTPRQHIESLGIGVFVRRRNVESRLSEKDFHRAYTEPGIVWISPGEYQEEKIESVIEAAKKFYAVQCFRFPNVRVSVAVLDRIRGDFPKARVEGVKKKTPSQSPHRNAGSRPSFNDTSASDTPHSLGPRG